MDWMIGPEELAVVDGGIVSWGFAPERGIYSLRHICRFNTCDDLSDQIGFRRDVLSLQC